MRKKKQPVKKSAKKIVKKGSMTFKRRSIHEAPLKEEAAEKEGEKEFEDELEKESELADEESYTDDDLGQGIEGNEHTENEAQGEWDEE